MRAIEVVTRVLAGWGSDSFRASSDIGSASALIDAAAEHDVECLFRWAAMASGVWSSLPEVARIELDERARASAAVEAMRAREMKRVFSRFNAEQIPVLVLKGGALSYTHYPAPYLRPRRDTDILVQPSAVQKAAALLGELGYRRRNSVTREVVHRQWGFELESAFTTHVIDLHWGISNRPLFASMLTFDDLSRDAVAVPDLYASARAPGPVHALFLACIHRVAHHEDSGRLIWLYDIKVLAQAMSADDWASFWSLCREKGTVRLCAQGLSASAASLGGTLASASWLMPSNGAPKHLEESARYLGGTRTAWRSLSLDIRATRGLFAKAQLVAAHAVPHPSYMRQVYGANNSVALSAAYLRRGAVGAWRLLSSVSVNSARKGS